MNFADNRTIDSINLKLNSLVQGNKSLKEYYTETIDLQTVLLNTVDKSQGVDVAKGQYIVHTNNVLSSFISGLNPSLGYIVRVNKPKNLKEAYDICQNEIARQHASNERNKFRQNIYVKSNIQKPISPNYSYPNKNLQQYYRPPNQNNFQNVRPHYNNTHNSPMHRPQLQPARFNPP